MRKKNKQEDVRLCIIHDLHLNLMEGHSKTTDNSTKTVSTLMMFKNSFLTSKKIYFIIAKIRWLTLFKKVINVCYDYHVEPTTTKYSIVAD